MTQTVITEGNRAVVITVQGRQIFASLYVNAKNGLAGWAQRMTTLNIAALFIGCLSGLAFRNLWVCCVVAVALTLILGMVERVAA